LIRPYFTLIGVIQKKYIDVFDNLPKRLNRVKQEDRTTSFT